MANCKFHKILIGLGVAGLSLASLSSVRASVVNSLIPSNVTNVSASGQISSPKLNVPVVQKRAVLNTAPTAANQAAANASSGAFACANCSALAQSSNVPLNLDGGAIKGLFDTTASLTFPQPVAQDADAQAGLDILPDWERTSTYQNYQASLSMSRATFSAPFWDASTGFNADAVRKFFSFLPQEYADESFGPKGTPLIGMPVSDQTMGATTSSPLFQQPTAAALPGLPLVTPGSGSGGSSDGVSPFAALMSSNFFGNFPDNFFDHFSGPGPVYKVSGDRSKTDLA